MTETVIWMIYGANGYTGRRIAEEAVHRGFRPILAGRSQSKLDPLADALKCPARAFSLDDVSRVASELAGCRAVLHCAGPFSATSRPMLDACLRAGAHYLDITGEIDVIEAAAARHEETVRAGISVIPAVGFDVVPSDCLAAMLAARLPAATHLQLAFSGVGPPSPGTTNTMLERLHGGGLVRSNGQITRVPIVWKTMEIPFREGRQTAATIPWGDVAAAWYTTGIPNIEVYMAMPAAQIRWLRRLQGLLPLLKNRLAKSLARPVLRRMVGRRSAAHPDGASSFWGRVFDAEANSVEATLTGPGAYRLTVLTALECLERTLAAKAPVGFSTPSRAFGKEFILEVSGMEIEWR
ncbi:MAG: saccharopine dehydrogenase NADP-binding domain-containing protein [Pirellulales bacterium]|nr:saccharopine dehydrogenase NADP-binding domain-containing protein [Pirellulales bacterium]